ncbi:MAG: phosphomethylpyrimidine synthase, partial [Euryarchaeota archaeon]|nr:phosphomethylpyrimidine synthase [Euryarchaeota archaeon]
MMVFRGSYMDLLGEISKNEGIEETVLRRRIESGRIVVPYNPVHSPRPCGVGEGLSVKINVNVGTSRDRVEVSEELEKVDIALRYGADAIMDLSTGGDIDAIRRTIIKASPMPVGTVPIYQTGLRMARKSAVVDMDEDDMFNGFVQHARDGVDFMTVHCG